MTYIYCNILESHHNFIKTDNFLKFGIGIIRNKSSYLILTIYDILKINTISFLNFLFFTCYYKQDKPKNKFSELNFDITISYKKYPDTKLNFVSDKKLIDEKYKDEDNEESSWGWFVDTDRNY